MSNDTVDDLHAAEDGWGSAVACLEEILAGLQDGGGMAVERARTIIATHEDYCRPTCGFRETGECESGGEDEGCGCPCGHHPMPEEATSR